MSEMSIQAVNLYKSLTLEVSIKGMRIHLLRMKIAMFLMHVSSKLIGCQIESNIELTESKK